jgi:ABC-2 type transport system ATP-binding protein
MNALPLEATGVTKQFGRSGPSLWDRALHRRNGHAKPPVRAVDNVSFRIRQGEIYGVLGANGSGKSTLIRILSTLLLPDEGQVSIFGMDVVRRSMEVRRLINRVSADPSFFRNMSAMENLLFFGRVYGLTPGEVKEKAPVILKRLGLGRDKARETMTNLSRGQQQKVAVARAFLTSPMLLLLDEPTTGLDPRSKRDVQAFIREVQVEHDATILLTTHDMEEAEILCDRISFLAGGRIVAEGTPLELRESVARRRGADLREVTMETVFMEITGRSIEEDEEQDEDGTGGRGLGTGAGDGAEALALVGGSRGIDASPHVETEGRYDHR